MNNMKIDKLFILVLTILFLAFTIIFDTFKRSKYSILEKRDLTVFPNYTYKKLRSGVYTKAISSWFSDTEPFRDNLMSLSMSIKGYLKLETPGDNITFHASSPQTLTTSSKNKRQELSPEENRFVEEYENDVTADENAKIANAGIIIVGSGNTTRALMAYGGGAKGCLGYAEAANKYKETFGKKVNIYCMVIPTAVEFYCPDKAKKCTNQQRPTINNVYSHLSDSVKAVDIYTTLGKHSKENIYLRTDHHWSPLGAYYAAGCFAKVAKVPFRDLSNYDKKVIHEYVGSMYGYSKDIAIKKAPEDFIYYVPRNIKYTTTYINYTVNENFHITKESKPFKGKFFAHFHDGSGGAYCTFMGGDTKITKVETSTKNGRRLIILKDSFGNALPGYLFYSFEQIHVIDSRYFNKNMKEYVRNNRITDILFANNIFKAYSKHTYGAYIRFLKQNKI
jgi:hypothetical protein